jgi:hypothetical protein
MLTRHWKLASIFAAFIVFVAALVWRFGTSEELAHFIEMLDKHNGAITAVFTVFLTIVTGGLVWTGYKQIMTTRAQLRAYVLTSRSIVTNIVTNVVHGDGVPEAQVTLQNYGQTPAHNVISVSGFAFDKYPSNPNMTISDQEFLNPSLSRELLGPGGTSVSIIRYVGGPFTPATKASLANGGHIIYVYGEIRYRDVFGRTQRTKYRYMTGGPVGVRGEQMVGCEEGNEAT